MTVLNPDLIAIKTITLYDITGKLLFNNVTLESKTSYDFSTASYSAGVYLVKILSTDGQNKVQKIIIDSK